MNAVIAAMPRSGIRELMDLAWATPGVIHLEVGEPDFATPDHILEAAARAAADGYTKYTPNAGIPEVRAAFADKVVTHNHFAATADQVVVTVGAINALAQSVMILANPGESVLIPDPGWPNYEMIATVTGTVPVRYPLLRGEGFVPDLDVLEAAAADPAATLMIINSPATPTGAEFRQHWRAGVAGGVKLTGGGEYTPAAQDGERGEAPAGASATSNARPLRRATITELGRSKEESRCRSASPF